MSKVVYSLIEILINYIIYDLQPTRGIKASRYERYNAAQSVKILFCVSISTVTGYLSITTIVSQGLPIFDSSTLNSSKLMFKQFYARSA